MDFLFSGGQLDDVLQATVAALNNEVEAWEPDQLLAQSESEIVAYLADKHAVSVPTLLRDEMYADEPRDVKQYVNDDFSGRGVEITMSRVQIHVPYEGETVIFSLRPNSWTYSPPQADVAPNELVFTFEARELDGERIQEQLNRELADIEKWLGWCSELGTRHNDSLPSVALGAVQRRKERLLADRKTVAGLGIPVRRRGDPPNVAVPVRQRRPQISRPRPASGPYEPEPALSDSDYDEAVRVLVNAGKQLERSPSTSRRLDEEERRDLMLVALNSVFEGQAGGEVFNGAGKTDILLRIDNRNVFIVECKIWRGTKAFVEAIDQLLGYLVWRDTKAVLVLFIETRDATQTIARALEALEQHPNCIRALTGGQPEDRRDFVFSSAGDDSREIKLAFLPVVIAPPTSEPAA
jgi:hypothetical protein